ncbi:unnamed protein product [Prorocentrum cordatum]|uniref:Polyadenylate-binding protein n=1 Tax=Prorocentrum cordatum TaxID=2364126 RepID=A0ABN9YH17_9DINO|nr:unnamed protein product [Polarella glacialis]
MSPANLPGPSRREQQGSRVFLSRCVGVGALGFSLEDKKIDNKALYDTFSLFGNILSCKVASDSEGNSHGYGFVHYETEESAQQAIERVNGMQIGEKTVQVSRFVKREERPQKEDNYTNLYIKGFPDDWDEEKIVAEASQFGPIKASAVRTDKMGRRMAFVDFESTEDAHKCVEQMHMKDLRTEDGVPAPLPAEGEGSEVGSRSRAGRGRASGPRQEDAAGARAVRRGQGRLEGRPRARPRGAARGRAGGREEDGVQVLAGGALRPGAGLHVGPRRGGQLGGRRAARGGISALRPGGSSRRWPSAGSGEQEAPARPVRPVPRKRTLCKFWLAGTCSQPEGSCTWAHGEAELGAAVPAAAAAPAPYLIPAAKRQRTY